MVTVGGNDCKCLIYVEFARIQAREMRNFNFTICCTFCCMRSIWIVLFYILKCVCILYIYMAQLTSHVPQFISDAKSDRQFSNSFCTGQKCSLCQPQIHSQLQNIGTVCIFYSQPHHIFPLKWVINSLLFRCVHAFMENCILNWGIYGSIKCRAVCKAFTKAYIYFLGLQKLMVFNWSVINICI